MVAASVLPVPTMVAVPLPTITTVTEVVREVQQPAPTTVSVIQRITMTSTVPVSVHQLQPPITVAEPRRPTMMPTEAISAQVMIGNQRTPQIKVIGLDYQTNDLVITKTVADC